MTIRGYDYYRSTFAHLPKPFAYLDLDLLDQNIEAILQNSGQKRIRIASKSIRCVDVLRYIMKKSERFQGVMCYSIPEAVFLLQQGFDDLLVAYPAYEPSHLQEAIKWIQLGNQITLMVDSIEHVKQIEALASQANVKVPVCLDVDLSVSYPGLHFGVMRSPIRTIEQALTLADSIQFSPWVELDGLMGYEAQVAGVGDRMPGQKLKNGLIRLLKKQSIHKVAEKRKNIVEALEGSGMKLRFVNGGGTGSLIHTAKEEVVTEVTVGSGFYSPVLFDYYQDFRYLPAAGFAIEITRTPIPHIFTCAGGGYIASGAVGPEKLPQPFLPEGAKLLPLEGAGEVQTPIRYQGSESLKLGDPIFLRHSKAGELCERFLNLHWISDGKIVHTAQTYRGQGRCFI